VAQKSKLQTFVHIFAKYSPIFKIYFHPHILWKICNSGYQIYHHTLKRPSFWYQKLGRSRTMFYSSRNLDARASNVKCSSAICMHTTHRTRSPSSANKFALLINSLIIIALFFMFINTAVIDCHDLNLILMLDLRRFGRRSKPTKLETPCFWYQFLVSVVQNLDTSFW